MHVQKISYKVLNPISTEKFMTVFVVEAIIYSQTPESIFLKIYYALS